MTTTVDRFPQMEAGGTGGEDSEAKASRRTAVTGCGGAVLFFVVLYMSTCWGMIQPTEYGLLRSGITGTVDMNNVFDSGRHFIGWGNEFILFPSKLTTITIVVQARTGPGENDNSGGQPITLDVSFQYRFERARIPDIYRNFGMMWENAYRRFSAQAVTNAAQRFTPFAFWQIRSSVEAAMLQDVRASLLSNGFADVAALQLVAVSFRPDYEETITRIQLQEQLGVTRQFQLGVTAVEQEIAVLQSQTDAQVLTIGAEANRAAAVIINAANNDALVREQSAKANMYAQIRTHLNWTQPQFLDYIRLKALNDQPAQAKVKVAMAPIGATPTSAGGLPQIPVAPVPVDVGSGS